MKKAALILLILIYSMSSFGVTFNEFYCCGKLKAISVTLSEVGKDKATKDTDKGGCCKTKLQSFKVKDTHIAAEKITSLTNYFVDLQLCNSTFQDIFFVSQKTTIAYKSNAPPLPTKVPIYIYNSTFLI